MVSFILEAAYMKTNQCTFSRAAPRLKDASIPQVDLPTLYTELLIIMRRLYHVCKLVHADLSEYNILYHNSHLYIIDVSQSVEHDHPSAFDFLRSDIRNVETFFGRDGVHTLGSRRVFDFVTREDISNGQGDFPSALEPILQQWLNTDDPEPEAGADQDQTEPGPGGSEDKDQDDEVFLKSYIPRTLNDVYDPERDIARLQRGEGKELIYGDLTGVVRVNEGEARVIKDKGVESDPSADSDSDGGEQDSEEEDGDGQFVERKPRGKRHEDKDVKKVQFIDISIGYALNLDITTQERKKAVKEETREKRKHKMPKAEKKRRMKATKA